MWSLVSVERNLTRANTTRSLLLVNNGGAIQSPPFGEGGPGPLMFEPWFERLPLTGAN
jgi:hypothetical protein